MNNFPDIIDYFIFVLVALIPITFIAAFIEKIWS